MVGRQTNDKFDRFSHSERVMGKLYVADDFLNNGSAYICKDTIVAKS